MKNSAHPGEPGSFLVADCGTATTNVALFDVAAGSYRLLARAVAPTTASPPWSNLMIGVRQAISQIAKVTGRKLLSDNGSLIKGTSRSGVGVDYFGATISAAEPLRAVIAGLLEDVSVASARRALHTIYAEEIDSFSLSDERTEQAQVNAILAHHPDLILLTGGVDGGEEGRLLRLIEVVETGISLLNGEQPPHVIYAGNRQLREKVTAALSKYATVRVADNVRPNLGTEQLGDTVRLLSESYERLMLASLPGIDEVREASNYPLLSTARAFALMLEYFAALYDGAVLGVDIGSSSVTLVAADPQRSRLVVRSDLGLGKPLPGLLDKSDAAEVAAWLPGTIAPATLFDYIYDKQLHPHTIPMTEEDLFLEQALARHVSQLAARAAGQSWDWPAGHEGNLELPPFKLIILRGGVLANSPRPAQALLVLLDALQPTGLFAVAVDRHNVLPSLGLLAPHEPATVVQVLEGGALMDLGWVIALAGEAEAGEHALHVTVESERQGRLEIDVKYGELEVVPLAVGETAQLTLEPSRRLDLGKGPGRGQKATIHGGHVGLVIDARGRPLRLPSDPEARQSRLRQWRWDVGG